MAFRSTKTLEQRFGEKIWYDPETGCIEWMASTRQGYGQIGVGLGVQYAHRIAWVWAEGPIPTGLVIDHLCRNRRCQNTAHMEVVTNETNILRGEWSPVLNTQKTHCPQGHAYSGSNLYVGKGGDRHCMECRRARKRRYRQEAAERE